MGPGMSQTQTVQTVLQMYRDADYWKITPEELCKVFLLNSVQTENTMVKVNEQLEETDEWNQVGDYIITVDRAEALSKNYLNNPKNNKQSYSGATVQTKIKCLACVRKKLGKIKITRRKMILLRKITMIKQGRDRNLR